MLRQAILEMLHKRGAKPGETIEFSWFVLKVVEGPGGIDVETLDFREMASFTSDLAAVEQIHQQQMLALQQAGAAAERCTLRHYALVDPHYQPGHPRAFMHRRQDAIRADSGWRLGLCETGLRLDALRKYEAISLYEICLQDQRWLPFWLLPVGYSVVFQDDAPRIVSPGQSDRYFTTFPPRPWWKIW